jgi:hypothetical protein
LQERRTGKRELKKSIASAMGKSGNYIFKFIIFIWNLIIWNLVLIWILEFGACYLVMGPPRRIVIWNLQQY